MKLKLDAKTIPALVLPKGRRRNLLDAELEGFGLRLRRRADGGLLRNWVTQYRAGGHTRRVTIGSVDKVTPTQARDAARKSWPRLNWATIRRRRRRRSASKSRARSRGGRRVSRGA